MTPRHRSSFPPVANTSLWQPQHASHASLMKLWLWGGIVAVGVSGLYAIILAAVHGARGLKEALPFKDFFHTALIVHVDLSVLLWFVAMAALFSLWHSQSTAPTLTSRAAAYSFWGGLILMSISPFTAEGHPSLNNYIPMLQQPLFVFSLGLVTSALLLQLAHGLRYHRLQEESSPLHPLWFGVHVALWVLAGGLALMVASYVMLPPGLSGEAYYELLYWAGGHLWQFAWVQCMAIGWLLLATLTGQPIHLHRKLLQATLAFPLLMLLLSPLPFALYDIEDYAFQRFYTLMMDIGNGLYILPIGYAVLRALWQGSRPVDAHGRVLYYALLSSLLVFTMGGVIALGIEGTNVIIPAHYHGSIVGVTLCFIGLAYALFPALGYGQITHWSGRWHTPVYAFGQILHVAGLLISGGYDVARKSTGEVLELGARIGLGMTGAGGGLAIISGLLFLTAIIKAYRTR